MPLAGNLSALQAVINSGGFRDTADPKSAIIIRKGKDNQPIPIHVNLYDAIHGNSPDDILLLPEDVVYIPRSSIANANLFVKQYIQDLLLIRGIGFGLTYELNQFGN